MTILYLETPIDISVSQWGNRIALDTADASNIKKLLDNMQEIKTKMLQKDTDYFSYKICFHVKDVNKNYDFIGVPLNGCGTGWNSMTYIYRTEGSAIRVLIIYPQENTYYCPLNMWK